MRVLAACWMLALTVFQGMTLCLCALDPDDCGHACHECSTIPEPECPHLEHVCDHFNMTTLPPGEVTPDLLDALRLLFDAVAPAAPRGADGETFQPVSFSSGSPPDVPPPQLIFIARSKQFLC
jgi:hypothetical protein